MRWWYCVAYRTWSDMDRGTQYSIQYGLLRTFTKYNIPYPVLTYSTKYFRSTVKSLDIPVMSKVCKVYTKYGSTPNAKHKSTQRSLNSRVSNLSGVRDQLGGNGSHLSFHMPCWARKLCPAVLLQSRICNRDRTMNYLL